MREGWTYKKLGEVCNIYHSPKPFLPNYLEKMGIIWYMEQMEL